MKQIPNLMAAGVVLMAACADGHAPTRYVTLGESGEDLRTQFQADSGKVRALFLAAPT